VKSYYAFIDYLMLLDRLAISIPRTEAAVNPPPPEAHALCAVRAGGGCWECGQSGQRPGEIQSHYTVSTVSRVSDNECGAGLNHSPAGALIAQTMLTVLTQGIELQLVEKERRSQVHGKQGSRFLESCLSRLCKRADYTRSELHRFHAQRRASFTQTTV
jgi:hypothetical protein